MKSNAATLGALFASATLLLSLIDPTASRPSRGNRLTKRAQIYVNPLDNGGSMLTQTDSSSGGLGEPLNVIISGESDPQVLTPSGIKEYFESLYFSPGDCVGISLGGPQQANLGDGLGYVNQTDVLRFNYYQGDTGTCLESLRGGNHLRYWSQNGTSANTGAIFMAVSYEYNATLQHDIVPDGYDLGRDLLVGNATNSSGTTSPGGFKYTTTNTSAALLNTYSASQINHGIGVDGNVAILTVRVTKNGVVGGSNSNSGSSSSSSTSSGSRDITFKSCTLSAAFLALLWTGFTILI